MREQSEREFARWEQHAVDDELLAAVGEYRELHGITLRYAQLRTDPDFRSWVVERIRRRQGYVVGEAGR